MGQKHSSLYLFIYLFIYLNMHGFAYEYFMSLLYTSKSTKRSFEEDNVVILFGN